MSENLVSIPGIAATMWLAPTTTLQGTDVCIFVTYCPNGQVGAGLQYFLRKFVEQDIKVVLCIIVENEAVTVNVADLHMCSSVLVRLNTGYDFGAWAGTLRTLPQLWEAKRLFFVNDSILGPNENFGTLIANIRASREDFIALTANWIDVYHAQSYFFVYQNDALNSQCVKELWNSLPDYPTKVDVIRNCEQHQLAFLTNQGLSHKIMFPLLEQVAKLSSIEKVGFNPTHHAWRELLNLRFPFLKADLFYRSSQSLYGWNEFFRAEVIQWQLTELLSSRAAMTTTKIHSEHRSLAVVKFLIGSETFFKLRARWKRLKAERRSGIRVLW